MEKLVIREMYMKYRITRRKLDRCLFDSPEKVWALMRTMIGNETQEVFTVLCLDNKNNLVGWAEVSRGTVSEAIIHPREIFKFAIHSNSSSIVICHNHPSGTLSPSGDDIKTTRRLVEAGKILGIEVLDHVIVTADSFLSLKEEGFM